MKLSDIRDYIDSLEIANYVYMAKVDAKKEKAIGVYKSKHSHGYKNAIGGSQLQSYGTKYVTFLIHWNKSPRETENVSIELFQMLEKVRELKLNEKTIKFIQLITEEPVDIGTDENGIYEMVIEAAVIYER